MELADQFQIAALLASSATQVRREKPRMSRRSPGGLPPCEPPAHHVRQRRCRCGECAVCQENERWERIFQSKFADPDYYVRRVVRHDSPLNSL